jgi:chemotaxis protein CheX
MASEAALLKLDPVLGLAAATPLYDALREVRGRPVELEGAEVERIGGQCLHVLLAAKAAWAKDGSAFRIVNPSQQMTDSVELMGASLLFEEGGRA